MERFVADNRYNIPDINIYQTLGHRDSQEDFYVIQRLNHGYLLAVADGHNGSEVASLITNQLPLVLSEEIEHVFIDKKHSVLSLSSTQISNAIRSTFNRLINITKDKVSGSTLTVAFLETGTLRPSFTSTVRVTVGQLGDSFYAISSEPGKLNVAPLHNVQYQQKDVDKIKKIYKSKYGEECKSSNRYIFSSHVKYNSMALTRSLGDSAFTLVRKPLVESYLVNPDKTVLIIATDGILAGSTKPQTCILRIIDQLRQGTQISDTINSLGYLEDNTTIIAVRSFGKFSYGNTEK